MNNWVAVVTLSVYLSTFRRLKVGISKPFAQMVRKCVSKLRVTKQKGHVNAVLKSYFSSWSTERTVPEDSDQAMSYLKDVDLRHIIYKIQWI